MLQIVAIVCGHQRNAGFPREADNLRIDALFDVQALVLNFEKEISLAENVAQAVGGLARLIRPLFHQIFGDCAAQARRQSNQAAAVLGQQVVIDSGLVVKTFQVSRGDELDQIAIPFRIFAEQNEVVGAALPGFGDRRICMAVGGIALRRFAAIVAASLGDVHFAADDRLDAARLGCVVERFRRKEIAVIGDSHGRHFPARGFIDDLFEIARSIQQAVIRMQMQVNESGSFHAGGYSNRARGFLLRPDSVENESRVREPKGKVGAGPLPFSHQAGCIGELLSNRSCACGTDRWDRAIRGLVNHTTLVGEKIPLSCRGGLRAGKN